MIGDCESMLSLLRHVNLKAPATKADSLELFVRFVHEHEGKPLRLDSEPDNPISAVCGWMLLCLLFGQSVSLCPESPDRRFVLDFARGCFSTCP